MKKVKIVATAAALAVGGFLALESASGSTLTLTVHRANGGAGATLTFDETSTAQEMCSYLMPLSTAYTCVAPATP